MSKALSWLLVGEILAASQWDHNTGLWAQESESMFSSVVSFCQPEVSCWPRVGSHCCPGLCMCHSPGCPPPPQLWAQCRGTRQHWSLGDCVPCISAGLLCLTSWGLMGLCGSGWRCQHLKERLFFLPPPSCWGRGWPGGNSDSPGAFSVPLKQGRRYLICPCLLALPLFILYTETTLRTAGEEEEVQRGPGFQGRG